MKWSKDLLMSLSPIAPRTEFAMCKSHSVKITEFYYHDFFILIESFYTQGLLNIFLFQSFRAKQCKVSADCQKLFFKSGRRHFASFLSSAAPQCGNFRIILSFRFYVNPILKDLEVVNLPILTFLGL